MTLPVKPKFRELHLRLPFNGRGPHSFNGTGSAAAEEFWTWIAETLSARVSEQQGFYHASEEIRRRWLTELEPFAKAVVHDDGTADFTITDCRIGQKAWAKEAFSTAEIKGVRSVFAEGYAKNPMEVRFFKDDGTFVLWVYEAWFDIDFNVVSKVSRPKQKTPVAKTVF